MRSSNFTLCIRLVVAMAMLLAMALPASAQRLITGTVRDDKGEPLIGANVIEKGTTNGTSTDGDGQFALEVKEDAQALQVSYVGYLPREVSIAGLSTVAVVLGLDQSVLEEVVVTALGIEKSQKKVGYATQEVDGASLQQAREPNVLSNLTGKVAGLTIYNATGLFENSSIQLRGRSPLIVVDGVPVNTDFWDINPDDVESVNVLKGTAASALYGSIGRDGAIMITTRRARQDGFSVDYNSSTMFQAGWPILPEVQSQYGAGYGGQYAYVDGKGGGIQDGSGWIWGPKLDGRLLPQYDSPIDPETGERIPTPWIPRGKDNLKNFLETGVITTHNLSVSGKNEAGDFRLSASHMYQNGQEPNTDLNSTTFTIAGGYNFGQRLRADASLTYNKQYTDNYPRRGYGPQNYVYNLLLWTGPDVDVRDLRNYWMPGQEGLQQRHYNLAWYNNPYFAAFENLQPYKADNTYGYLALGYELAEGLSLKVRSGIDARLDEYELKTPKSYILYSDDVNGNYYVSNSYDFQVTNDLFLNYDKSFGDNFEINAMVGGSSRFRTRNSLYGNTSGLNIPGLYNLSNSMNDVTTGNFRGRKRVNSLFATVDFGISRAVYLGLTGRNDWSSSLPPDNNSYFYPSVSLSTVISELVELPSAVSFLKLRASWAQVSGDLGSEGAGDLGAYDYLATYESGVNWDGTASVFYPGTIANQQINPFRATTLEVGGDARFFNNRLGLDVSYYRTIDDNNIINFPVSQASGFSAVSQNANVYRRTGLEFVLNTTPIRAGKVNWGLNFNWARYRRYLDEITSPFGSEEEITELDGVAVGDRTDVYRGDIFLRAPDGQIIIDGNSGLPLIDPNRQTLGYTDPDWVAGVNSLLTVGPVTLGLSVDTRQGGIFYSQTIRKMWWGGTHPGSVTPDRDMENEGVKSYVGQGVVVTEGQIVYDENGNIVEDTRVFAPNETPVFWSNWLNSYYHGASEESNLYDASFVKLREVTLTYQLPRRWISAIGLSEASIAFVGRNLFLWTENDYVDPDPYGTPTGGEEYLQTPPSRNLGFNVNLKF